MSRRAEKAVAAIPTRWIEAGSVRVLRGERPGGEAPLFLRVHGCDGELGDRPFNVSMNATTADMIVSFSEYQGRPARAYVVSTRDVLAALGEHEHGLASRTPSTATLTQRLALALTKLDVTAAQWTELDSTEVSQVTDEHLRTVVEQAEAMRAAAEAVLVHARGLIVVRAQKGGA